MPRTILVLCASLIVSTCATQFGAPATELLETYWRAEQVDGRPVGHLPGTRELHIVFGRDASRVSGFAGCNGFFGGFEHHGETLRFGNLGMTRMACMGEGDALEAAFTRALGSTASYRIVGNQLELRDKQGAVRLIFQARGTAQTVK
jgi:heat shock protein HslJ